LWFVLICFFEKILEWEPFSKPQFRKMLNDMIYNNKPDRKKLLTPGIIKIYKKQ